MNLTYYRLVAEGLAASVAAMFGYLNLNNATMFSGSVVLFCLCAMAFILSLMEVFSKIEKRYEQDTVSRAAYTELRKAYEKLKVDFETVYMQLIRENYERTKQGKVK